jgi:hypothetical protein
LPDASALHSQAAPNGWRKDRPAADEVAALYSGAVQPVAGAILSGRESAGRGAGVHCCPWNFKRGRNLGIAPPHSPVLVFSYWMKASPQRRSIDPHHQVTAFGKLLHHNVRFGE